jgi:hypothetical protein
VKRLIVTAALLFMASAMASAQDVGRQYREQVYAFIGQGTYSYDSGLYRIDHVGGGGEVRLFKELGVGSELGAMGTLGNGVGLFSIDPSYHFRPSSNKSKLVPFVDAGYTRTFGNRYFTNSQNLFNFGGGIYYWPFKRVGLRADFRDYVDHSRLVTNHYPAFRIGLALR